MSKRNRIKRHLKNDIHHLIHQTLRNDFSCTEDEIDLIDHALHNEVTQDIADRMQAIQQEHTQEQAQPPVLRFEVVEDFNQDIKLSNHPSFPLLDYLEEQHGERFGFLYWHAITSGSREDFYKGLQLFKQTPLIHRRLVTAESPNSDDYPRALLAIHAQRAMDSLAPLIRAQPLSPVSAIVMAAAFMDLSLSGEQRGIPEDALLQICKTIMSLWKAGDFTPCKEYPYTVEQTFEAWKDGEVSEVKA